MNILQRTITDTYKGKSKTVKTIRVDKEIALKLDKIIDYCREEKGTKISQNQVLAGILNSFIMDYEEIVQANPDKANSKVLALVE